MKHDWNRPDTSALLSSLMERHAKALKRLGEEIALRRKEKNITPAELADLAGVREVDVARLELGDEVQSHTAKAIITALGVDVSIIESVY